MKTIIAAVLLISMTAPTFAERPGQVHVTTEGVITVIGAGFDLRGEGGAGEGGA